MLKKTPRTFKRISYIALASLKTPTQSTPIEAYIINFSYGGVAIYTKEDFEGQVEITLYLEGNGGKTVAETLWGNVAWKRNVGSMTAWGIEFGNLNPQDHSVTMALMEELLK
ncbi:MAG TPA: PilZ domain-containing protein [Nitrospiria bacterium]|jgi:hypothetical protein